jgi:deoxyribonuclease V
MPREPLHGWDVGPAAAVALQRRLAPLVEREDRLGEIRRVAGVDVGFRDGMTRAAIAVLGYPDLELLAVSRVERPTTFPYVPGLLSFREAPAILDAYSALDAEPDLLIVDGQGRAHPRRFGIACHLGLYLDRPAIGSAKSVLVGRHGPLGDEPGATAELVDRGEVVGLAVRTKARVKPVYVSVGHRVSLATAARLVLACARGYRLPEPQRRAHLAASAKPSFVPPSLKGRGAGG